MDQPLLERIRTEIRTQGPISFARFMERALTEPGLGYYVGTQPRAGRDPRGDALDGHHRRRRRLHHGRHRRLSRHHGALRRERVIHASIGADSKYLGFHVGNHRLRQSGSISLALALAIHCHLHSLRILGRHLLH